MKFSIKDFSSKCEQICKSLVGNFIFCAMGFEEKVYGYKLVAIFAKCSILYVLQILNTPMIMF